LEKIWKQIGWKIGEKNVGIKSEKKSGKKVTKKTKIGKIL